MGPIVSPWNKYVPAKPVTDLGNVALLPGFINAHTHLEFSLLKQPLGQPGMPFADWIGEVVAFRRGLAAEGTDLSGLRAAGYRRWPARIGRGGSRGDRRNCNGALAGGVF